MGDSDSEEQEARKDVTSKDKQRCWKIVEKQFTQGKDVSSSDAWKMILFSDLFPKGIPGDYAHDNNNNSNKDNENEPGKSPGKTLFDTEKTNRQIEEIEAEKKMNAILL